VYGFTPKFTQKMSFGVILRDENSFIGLKKLLSLITPTPKYLRWHSYFYRIGS